MTKKDKVTIHCVGGLKLYGNIVDITQNILSDVKWIVLSTSKTSYKINVQHIISIEYGNTRTSRQKN